MAMKKALVSAVMAVGIAAGGTLVASPAHASSTWGWNWDTEQQCHEGTVRKMNHYNKRGYDFKLEKRCEYHKQVGRAPAFWYSQIRYTQG